VLAERIVLELRVDLAERFLADLSRAARRQLVAVALAPEVPLLLQDLQELLELVQCLSRFVAEQFAQLLLVDVFDVAAVLRALELALQLVHGLHAVHQRHRLVEVDLLIAAERVLVAHVAHRRQELQVHLQLLQLGLQVRVSDLVGEQILQLLAHVAREAVEQILHLCHLALHALD
jgi:hypothetical protein